MKQQMLDLCGHIQKQTVADYERCTGTVTMFNLLPAEAKVKLCKLLLKEPGKTLQAIEIIDYLRMLSEERYDYAEWGKSEELQTAYTKAKYRIGIINPIKVVRKKTV